MTDAAQNAYFTAGVGSLSAEIQKVAAPSRQPHRAILSNGLAAIFEQSRAFPLIGVSLVVRAGCVDERSFRCPAAAHIVEHLVLRRDRFPKELQWLGAEVHGRTYFDRTEFSLSTSSDNLPQALAVILCLATSRKLDESAFSLEKDIVAQENDLLNRHEDEVLSNLFWDFAFPEFDVQQLRVAERPETSFDGVRSFYEQEYKPSNMVCSVAGNLNLEDIERLAEDPERIESKDQLVRGEFHTSHSPASVGESEPKTLKVETNSKITRWLSGYIVEPFSLDRIHELDILAAVINHRTKSLVAQSELLRESLLNLNSFFYPLRGKGLLLIKSAFKPEATQEVQYILQKVITEIKTAQLGEAEITFAKARLIHRVLSSYFLLDRARTLAINEFRGLPLDFDASYIESVKSISSADILRGAQNYLDDARERACFLVPRQGKDNCN